MNPAERSLPRAQPAERRPLKDAIGEMLAFNLLMVMLGGAAVLVISRVGAASFDQSTSPWLLQLGDSALTHLGWGLGIATTVVFGCLVASAGGQLFFGNTSEEAQLRRSLGVLAELTVSSMLPVTLLAASASLFDPALLGALFVIAPIYLVLWVLSVQVGRFVVLEWTARLEKAQKDQEWARGLLATLKGSSRTPAWRALPAVCAASMAPAAAVTLIWDSLSGERPLSTSASMLILCGVTAALLTYLYIECNAGHLTRRSTSETVANWLLPGYVTIIAFLISPVVFIAGWRYGVGYLCAVLIPLAFGVQGFASVNARPLPMRPGPIGGAARRSARRTAGRALSRAHKTVVELAPHTDSVNHEQSENPEGSQKPEAPEIALSKWQRIVAVMLDH